MTACIGEPVSWLRLEQFALGEARDPAAIEQHLAACPACARCLHEIRADLVALPALPALPVHAPTRSPWRWLAPALGLAGAAAAVALVLRRTPPPPEGVAGIKGIGDVQLELVRERGGDVQIGARTYLPGDRFKVVLTCPPGPMAWVDVEVSDGKTIDRPLAPAQIACGNRVVVPGAFTLSGPSNQVCARVGASAEGERGRACRSLATE